MTMTTPPLTSIPRPTIRTAADAMGRLPAPDAHLPADLIATPVGCLFTEVCDDLVARLGLDTSCAPLQTAIDELLVGHALLVGPALVAARTAMLRPQPADDDG